jgi:hypothetical protein
MDAYKRSFVVFSVELLHELPFGIKMNEALTGFSTIAVFLGH